MVLNEKSEDQLISWQSIQKLLRLLTEKYKYEPQGDGRFPTSVGIITWDPWMSRQKFMAIHLTVLGYFCLHQGVIYKNRLNCLE